MRSRKRRACTTDPPASRCEFSESREKSPGDSGDGRRAAAVGKLNEGSKRRQNDGHIDEGDAWRRAELQFWNGTGTRLNRGTQHARVMCRGRCCILVLPGMMQVDGKSNQ